MTTREQKIETIISTDLATQEYDRHHIPELLRMYYATLNDEQISAIADTYEAITGEEN